MRACDGPTHSSPTKDCRLLLRCLLPINSRSLAKRSVRPSLVPYYHASCASSHSMRDAYAPHALQRPVSAACATCASSYTEGLAAVGKLSTAADGCEAELSRARRSCGRGASPSPRGGGGGGGDMVSAKEWSCSDGTSASRCTKSNLSSKEFRSALAKPVLGVAGKDARTSAHDRMA